MRHREALAQARKRGKRQGESSASWVFDGNTPDNTRAKVARMIADGDPAIDSYVPEPSWLSGEWAGESINELLGDLFPVMDGCDDYDAKFDEICEAYENAASTAFWRTVERDASR